MSCDTFMGGFGFIALWIYSDGNIGDTPIVERNEGRVDGFGVLFVDDAIL